MRTRIFCRNISDLLSTVCKLITTPRRFRKTPGVLVLFSIVQICKYAKCFAEFLMKNIYRSSYCIHELCPTDQFLYEIEGASEKCKNTIRDIVIVFAHSTMTKWTLNSSCESPFNLYFFPSHNYVLFRVDCTKVSTPPFDCCQHHSPLPNFTALYTLHSRF